MPSEAMLVKTVARHVPKKSKQIILFQLILFISGISFHNSPISPQKAFAKYLQ